MPPVALRIAAIAPGAPDAQHQRPQLAGPGGMAAATFGSGNARGPRIHGAEGAAREGLHAMTGTGDLPCAVWLDPRGKGTRPHRSAERDRGLAWSNNAADVSAAWESGDSMRIRKLP